MRIKETRDVAHMIERFEAQEGGGSVPDMLELNTTLSGTWPVTATIEDEEDIAKLNAIASAYGTEGKLPPLYYKSESVEEGDSSCLILNLSEIEVNTESSYILYTRTFLSLDVAKNELLALIKEGDTWTATLTDGAEE